MTNTTEETTAPWKITATTISDGATGETWVGIEFTMLGGFRKNNEQTRLLRPDHAGKLVYDLQRAVAGVREHAEHNEEVGGIVIRGDGAFCEKCDEWVID